MRPVLRGGCLRGGLSCAMGVCAAVVAPLILVCAVLWVLSFFFFF